jgi:hypothetical protein
VYHDIYARNFIIIEWFETSISDHKIFLYLQSTVNKKSHAISSVFTALFRLKVCVTLGGGNCFSEAGRHSRAIGKARGMTKTYYKVNDYNAGLGIHSYVYYC